MSQSTHASAIDVPDEVRAFAREQGLEERLPAVLEAAQQAFPGAHVNIALQEEPAVEALRYMIVTLRGVKGGEEEVMAAREVYSRALRALVGPPHGHEFGLAMEWMTEEEERGERGAEKPPIVPDDVWAFATPLRIARCLPAVLEMTRRVFPGCEPTVELEDDPDFSERYIVVNVIGVSLDVPQAVKARKAWCGGLRAACPGPEAHLVRLRLEVS